MNIHVLLDRLNRSGVRLHIDGDRLRWFAPVGIVTEADLAALREHKVEVLTILRDEENDRVEERASILQFDAYFSRQEAERRALDEQHSTNGGDAA